MSIRDRWEGIPLDELHYPDRAMAWYVRAANENGFPVEKRPQYHGAAFMVAGIQFHYDRYLENRKLVQATGLDWEKTAHHACAHDVIAYINRLGQFYFFAKAHIPEYEKKKTFIVSLMPMRMKFTAHRSCDAPRKESERERQHQAEAFGPDCHLVNGDLEYHLLVEGDCLYFAPQRDHPEIMQEIFAVFESIYSPKIWPSKNPARRT
ncbi:MAG: hypothetical protein BGO12_13080 [Verrucomicrobia bacterium 61-8]|nr:hypothetical protein [Verrucomicrobiota bacterium]OJV17721.1 MAG: hypothetical protein BGO12_13080 [Verrucomicrobia bacterium 61-8]